jgi:hypothetical protein
MKIASCFSIVILEPEKGEKARKIMEISYLLYLFLIRTIAKMIRTAALTIKMKMATYKMLMLMEITLQILRVLENLIFQILR